MEWEEDDWSECYSSEETVDVSDSDSDYGYSGEESVDNDDDHPTTREYTVLNESVIRKRLEEDISRVSTVLSISRVESIILLKHYKWDVNQLHDEWFTDEEKVRATVGLLVVHSSQKKDTDQLCGICFLPGPLFTMLSTGCGHLFCKERWEEHLIASISGGDGCLSLIRCPETSRNADIGKINGLSSDELDDSRFSVRSYVEEHKNIKWCPADDCEYAIEFDYLSGSVKDVACPRSHTFCWNCLEEAHRPLDCSTVAKWLLKNRAESDNVTWILSYTKPCPKCRRPIENDQGCNYMTCTPPCQFEFCWTCLEPWGEHKSAACSTSTSPKQKDGKAEEDETKREKSKKYLDRYVHYFGRWYGNQKLRVKALQDLQQLQGLYSGNLSCNAQVFFMVEEAWEQIVECRGILKWTYAYGFYLPESENYKRQLFEYLLGEAEFSLERLHRCVKKDLKVFLGDGDEDHQKDASDFSCFRSKLFWLTSVTRLYFENLVRALENGLSDVNPSAGPGAASGPGKAA